VPAPRSDPYGNRAVAVEGDGRTLTEVLAPYLAELGQAFMLTLAANKHMPTSEMWGERAMLEWPLNMALHWPSVEVPRLMYFSGLGKALDYGSGVLPEFQERTMQLLREARRENRPSARLAPLVWKIFGLAEDAEYARWLMEDADPAYQAWRARVEAPESA
jgi:hypothetical protein